jgi:hypothetical protein
MTRFSVLLAALFCACPLASAGDVLLVGHVQRVILQPSGTGDCPSPCGVMQPLPNGVQRICVSNAGGCQAMEVKVDHVYLGEAGAMREFRSRIGEWGPSFPVTAQQVVIKEEAGKVWWSPATVRDGRIFIHPKRLRTIGVPTSTSGNDEELVALDEVLERVNARRD